jgi:tetratricopeptide (TPR) repeat protein/tRNA A37 threonylcarbamoyladenosine biosynthesis protein TsaE
MQFSFTNRVNELRNLAKFCSACDASKSVSIAVIYGAEGVGKSTLVRKSIDEYIDDDHVHVSLNFNPYRSYESGAYIKKIAKELAQLHQKEGNPFSLEEFLAKGRSGHLVRRVAESIGMDLAGMVPGLSGPMKEIKATAQEISILKNAIFSTGNSETAELAAAYVGHVSQGRKTIIHIQNFQNIDQSSLDTIEDNVHKFQNMILFLEWTEVVGKKYEEDSISKRLKYAAPFIFSVEVKKLPIECLYEQIIANQQILFPIIANSYNKESGNLRDIERLFSVDGGKNINLSIDRANIENLKALPRARLVFLMLICLSHGYATFDFIEKAIEESAPEVRALIECERNSVSDTYVTKVGDYLRIDHDSTIRRLMNLPDFEFERQYSAQILQKNLISTHRSVEKMDPPTLLQYMQLSTICNDVGAMSEALEEIESKFGNALFPPDILRQIIEFSLRVTKMDVPAYSPLLMNIVRLLFGNNLLIDCVPITQHLVRGGGLSIFYHITCLLSSLQLIAADHWLSILENQICLNEIQTWESETYAQQVLTSLLRVWYLRLTGDVGKSVALYKQIEPDISVSKYIRAVYYRYCEIANHEEAIIYLEKAYELALEAGNRCLQNEIKLSMAMYHAESDEVTKAKNLIEEIEASGVNCGFLHKYALENDKVVCCLLESNKPTLDVLKSYRMNVVDPFDKTIIENNIMLGELAAGNTAKAQLNAAKAIGTVESSKFLEPNITRITYINASYVCLQSGEAEDALRYWELSKSIQTKVDEQYWNKVFSFSSPQECHRQFGCFTFPPFMTNWNIDPSIFLKHS